MKLQKGKGKRESGKGTRKGKGRKGKGKWGKGKGKRGRWNVKNEKGKGLGRTGELFKSELGSTQALPLKPGGCLNWVLWA